MATKRASLSELMGVKAGNSGGNLSLKMLPEILGDAMPELPRSAIGRHRLIRALQQRFGPNFRSLPGVMGLVKEFDSEAKFEKEVDTIRNIKLENLRGKSK